MIYWAYCQGAFPMADASGEVGWYRPMERAVFPLDTFCPSRSLAKVMRQGEFLVTFDQAFEEVMRGCLRPDGNWISEDFIRVYTEIHHQGWGHSCEVWAGEALVGGLYGLAIGSCFCAESMFHRRTNASKVALASMISHCRELGFTIFDAQIMNPHLASMGAVELSAESYDQALRHAIGDDPPWPPEMNLWKS